MTKVRNRWRGWAYRPRQFRNAMRFAEWLDSVGIDNEIKLDRYADSDYVYVTVPDGWERDIAGSWMVDSNLWTVRFSNHGQKPGGGWSEARQDRWGDSEISVDPQSKITPAMARRMVVDQYKKFGLWKRGKAVPENEWEAVATGRPREENVYRVPNPACGGTKPVELISDRAKRYRANHPDCKPAGPRRCALCGSRQNVDVHHLDGNEDHGDPANLIFACRKCNAAIGAAYARRGIGKRTRQYNAKGRAGGKAPSFQEYVAAVVAHRRGAWDEGGKVIHRTPPELRREYAARIWDLRRQRSGGKDEVPF